MNIVTLIFTDLKKNHVVELKKSDNLESIESQFDQIKSEYWLPGKPEYKLEISIESPKTGQRIYKSKCLKLSEIATPDKWMNTLIFCNKLYK